MPTPRRLCHRRNKLIDARFGLIAKGRMCRRATVSRQPEAAVKATKAARQRGRTPHDDGRELDTAATHTAKEKHHANNDVDRTKLT